MVQLPDRQPTVIPIWDNLNTQHQYRDGFNLGSEPLQTPDPDIQPLYVRLCRYAGFSSSKSLQSSEPSIFVRDNKTLLAYLLPSSAQTWIAS